MSAPNNSHDGRNDQPKNDISETTYPIYDNNTAKDLADQGELEQGIKSTWKSLWSKPQDLDAIATKRSVFDDEELGKFYVPPPDYENAHRFDSKFRWTFREERAVLRKVDFRILLWVLVMFFGLNIDRGNLGLAVSANLLSDLGLYVQWQPGLLGMPRPQTNLISETPTTTTTLRTCTGSDSSLRRFPVSL
jgi:hypothetical protein